MSQFQKIIQMRTGRERTFQKRFRTGLRDTTEGLASVSLMTLTELLCRRVFRNSAMVEKGNAPAGRCNAF